MTEKIIMYDSAEAAQSKTMSLTGWFCSNGHFHGNAEDVARYCGATHRACAKCLKPIKVRGYLICDGCRNKNEIENYFKMPFQEWDKVTPLYSQLLEEYFFDEDYLDCLIKDAPLANSKKLRLIICEPLGVPSIDEDMFYDYLPSGQLFDDVASEEVLSAITALNSALQKEKTWAWVPGDNRTEIMA
jgi:hypothetical protein